MTERVYYNEFDPFAAQWLRNLIASSLIPKGDVDERSIVDVRPSDLQGSGQAHFFAGIGGWAYALRLAEWPSGRPVWTGSCPCQPFSVAGKGKGVDDERHLWPAFHRLIAECAPAIVFGEQVASAAGRNWLDGVRTDLETLGYAVGAADLCAAGVDAPHIRQRLYWVAVEHAARERRGEGRAEHEVWRRGSAASSASGFDAELIRHESRYGQDDPRRTGKHGASGYRGAARSFWSDYEWRTGADGKARRVKPEVCLLAYGLPNRVGRLRGYGNAIVPQVAAEFVGSMIEATGTYARQVRDFDAVFGPPENWIAGR